MNSSLLRKELSDNLESYADRNSLLYSNVWVLTLFWEEDDLGVITEVHELSRMFREHFHYEVRQFVIPSNRPQASLARAISDFVFDYGGKDNLILLYYGGHGDPDDYGDREAVWAAKSHGGPTLRWHQIQPLLEGAEADILLLLDCCYGGQAARARSTHRVELLAAAAMNLQTPGVTARSFTKALISEIPKLLNDMSSITMTTVHRHLSRKEAGLVQQPFYAALSEDAWGSIKLQPLLKGPKIATIENSVPHEATALILRLSMFEKPTPLHKDEMMKWLTTARPSTISAITVEDVIARAEQSRTLGNCLLGKSSSGDSSKIWLNDISSESRAVLHTSFGNLQAAISFDSQTFEESNVGQAINTIQRNSDIFEKTVENCLVDLSAQSLKNIVQEREEGAKQTDISTLIDLRLLLLEATPFPETAVSGKIKFSTPPHSDQRFRVGEVKNCTILVEYWNYDAKDQSGHKIPSALLIQVKKIAALHAQLKSHEFGTLNGKGYIHELLPSTRVGMAYEIPMEHVGHAFTPLYDLYKLVPHVPVETRIRLACNISTALLHFHIIGWLHKGIKSENVLLFKNQTDDQTGGMRPKFSNIDFTNPYLFGFDYSRLEESESILHTDFSPDRNLYRHPERWGHPVKFQKKHDIYALGILLLEIGFWRKVATLDPGKNEFRKAADPEEVKRVLLHYSDERLAHYAGTNYAKATRFCLSCDTEILANGQYRESNFLRVFRKNVIEVLKEGC